MRARTLAILVLTAALSLPGFAQTDEDRAEVSALIAQFDADFRAGNMVAMFATMPPPVFDTLAASVGLPSEQFRALIIAEMEQVMEQVEIEDYAMDMDAARGGVSETGRVYFVIPTETIMTVPDMGRLRATSDTLALQDQGEWWLMRMEGPQDRVMLLETYPDLASIEFATAELEPLE